jgi:hypothetical protein
MCPFARVSKSVSRVIEVTMTDIRRTRGTAIAPAKVMTTPSAAYQEHLKETVGAAPTPLRAAVAELVEWLHARAA